MKFFVLTLFPEMFDSFLNTSILKKSIHKGLIEVELIDIRDFTEDKHNKTDDYPFGGGPGMVMTPQPLASAIKYAKEKSNDGKVVYFSPHGVVLRQGVISNLAKEEDIILLCGHYEGIDYRIIEKYIDLQISIGDYIVTGGELPAMVFIDSASRYVEGVLGNKESAIEESFTKPLLEHPQYTRPRVFENMEVPEVLLSGNHEKINQWRVSKSEEITQKNRPDLYESYKNHCK